MNRGYQLTDPTFEKQQNVVSFPLYPLTAKSVQHLTGFSNDLSMYVTSSILYLGILTFLAALLFYYYPVKIINSELAIFALNPFAIYFLNGYSEALWVSLVVAFCYFLMVKQRYLISALITGLASAARPYGFLLAPIFFYELVRAKASVAPGNPLRVPIMVSGLAAYMFYLWTAFNDPLVFMHGQRAWVSVSHRTLWSTFSPGKILSPIRDFTRGTFSTISVVMACVYYLANAALTVVYVRRMPHTFTALNVVFLLFFYLILCHFGSVGRFMTVCFPSSLALA